MAKLCIRSVQEPFRRIGEVEMEFYEFTLTTLFLFGVKSYLGFHEKLAQ